MFYNFYSYNLPRLIVISIANRASKRAVEMKLISCLLLFSICYSLRAPFLSTNLHRKLNAELINYEELSTQLDNNNNERIYEISNRLVDKTNATLTLINLINYGDQLFDQPLHLNKQSSNNNYNLFINLDHNTDWVKVKGCMADVRIKVTLNIDTNNLNYDESIYERSSITLDGIADSRVARGLLALLIEVSIYIYY